MANWKIGTRGGTCDRCARVFAEGERHVSTLLVNEEAQLLREDLCSDCWTPAALGAPGAIEVAPERVTIEDLPAGEAPSAGADDEGPSLFWWYTRFQEAKKKKTLQLDLAALEQIFVSLEGREEEPVRELRYLLCLILMRKRRVKLQKLDRSPEGESFLVKRPRKDQLFRVYVFDFSAERIAELRAQLQALFDGVDLETGLTMTGEPAGESAEVEGAEAGADRDDDSPSEVEIQPQARPRDPAETGSIEETAGASNPDSEPGESSDSAAPEGAFSATVSPSEA